MAKQFKDFNKEAKDLLTKNFPAAGSWKIESKEKGPDRTFILSPIAELKGTKASISVDVDYNIKQYNLKTKTNVSSTGVVKPKVTYEPAVGHKVETTLMNLHPEADFEIAYEGALAGALVYDRVTKKGGEAQVSYPVAAGLSVGAGVNWGFQKGLDSWAVGLRYVDKRFTATFHTKDLKKHITSLYAPIPVGACNAIAAATVECGHNACNFQVVVEGVVCADLKARVRVDQAGVIAFAFIKKFVNGWTAAVAIESSDVAKFGVQLTRE